MLFSGELSMTSVAPLLVPLLVLVVAELEAPPPAVVELLEEQAASPAAAMRPTAANATALLVRIGLIVNFDCPLGRYFCEGGFVSFSGIPFTSGDIA
jgi:hypothetical protein